MSACNADRNGADASAAPGFFISAFFFSLLSLLNDWGTPAWFSSFPLSSAFLFFDSLRLYSLSCFLHFALGLFVGRGSPKPWRRGLGFAVSFSPVFAFAVLVLLKTNLETAENALWVFEGVLSSAARAAAWYRLRRGARGGILGACAFAALGSWGMTSLAFGLRAAGLDPGFLPAALRFLLITGILLLAAFGAVRRPAAGGPIPEEAFSDFGISEREREVIGLVAEGKTNREIAEALFISLATVKTHLANVFEKTGCRNRTEVVLAFRRSPPPEA